jgi:hypothetical protein
VGGALVAFFLVVSECGRGHVVVGPLVGLALVVWFFFDFLLINWTPS